MTKLSPLNQLCQQSLFWCVVSSYLVLSRPIVESRPTQHKQQARSLCSGGGKRQIVESRLSQQKQQTRAANKTAEVTSPLPLSGSGKCQIVASRPTQRKQQARAASKTAEASLPISLAASAQQQSSSGKHNNASAAAISSPLPYLQRVIYCCRVSLLPTLL